jgi:aminopeptidase-like protein
MTLDIVQENLRFENLSPKGEPQLGPRGLFNDAERLGLLWLLSLSDGRHTLLDIAERSGLPFWHLLEGARRLEQSGLLRRMSERDAE